MYKIVLEEADHQTVNRLQKKGEKRNFLILIVTWIACLHNVCKNEFVSEKKKTNARPTTLM